MSSKRLILASTSPRRAQLLREAGYDFEQVAPPFDDTHYPMSDLPPRLAVSGLAYLKMASVADTLTDGVVLGCDTLVQLDDRALGKPTDADDARGMIEALSGRDHLVVTAVCFGDAASGRQEMLIDATTVRLGRLDPREIDRYIASGEWRGKAGGYNLGELRDRWPFEIIGDPTTVIGLPMQKLRPVLERYLASG